MGTITDEMITAWLDGELSPQQREEFEAAIAASPSLAIRVARLSRVDRMLAPAYADILKAPIPERFEALFDRAPVRRPMAGFRSMLAGLLEPRPLGMAAAALLVGVVVGGSLLTAGPAGVPGFETAADGRLVANSEMSVTLASLQSGEIKGSGAEALRIRLSMVDEAGHYCRQFETSSAAGLACLEDGKWKMDMLSPAKTSGGQGDYTMADGGSDPAIGAAIERRGVKQVLDREQETAAIAAGWKTAN